jgi:hypothetical protein
MLLFNHAPRYIVYLMIQVPQRFKNRAVTGLIVLSAVFFIGACTWMRNIDRPLTLCQLAENPADYLGKTITVEGNASGTLRMSLGDSNCPKPHWVDVDLADDYRPNADVQKFFSKDSEKIYRAHVIITGRYEKPELLCLFCSEYLIRATNINVVSEITSEPLPKFETETTRQDIDVR